MSKQHDISVVLPVYNEEGNIGVVLAQLVLFFQDQTAFRRHEIVVVDDGSDDDTSHIVQTYSHEISSIRVVQHEKNRGYGTALTTGFHHAQHPLVLFMDADGQFDIAQVEHLVSHIEDFDLVVGYRQQREDFFHRVVLGKLYTGLIASIFGLKMKDVNCGFKLFRREVLQAVLRRKKSFSKAGVFYAEIMLKAQQKGYRFKEIPVTHFSRVTGRETGASLKVIAQTLVDLVRLSFLSGKH